MSAVLCLLLFITLVRLWDPVSQTLQNNSNCSKSALIISFFLVQFSVVWVHAGLSQTSKLTLYNLWWILWFHSLEVFFFKAHMDYIFLLSLHVLFSQLNVVRVFFFDKVSVYSYLDLDYVNIHRCFLQVALGNLYLNQFSPPQHYRCWFVSRFFVKNSLFDQLLELICESKR